MKFTKLFLTIAIVSASFNLSGCDGNNQNAGSVANPAKAKDVIKISSIALSKAYSDNEAGADMQYKGKLLAVTGRVTGISKDIMDDVVVNLNGANQFNDIHATVEKEAIPQAAKLKKGQKVTLQCKGNGEVISAPMLDDCIFMSNDAKSATT